MFPNSMSSADSNAAIEVNVGVQPIGFQERVAMLVFKSMLTRICALSRIAWDVHVVFQRGLSENLTPQAVLVAISKATLCLEEVVFIQSAQHRILRISLLLKLIFVMCVRNCRPFTTVRRRPLKIGLKNVTYFF